MRAKIDARRTEFIQSLNEEVSILRNAIVIKPVSSVE
jgi:hypothetical protein